MDKRSSGENDFLHSLLTTEMFNGYSIVDYVDSWKEGVQLPCHEAILGPELDWFNVSHGAKVPGNPLASRPIKPEPLITEKPGHPPDMRAQFMDYFPEEKVTDFKHIIYNLLVESNNKGGKNSFVSACQIVDFDGRIRSGFYFNEALQPDKRLPEMYAQYIRKAPQLEMENQSSIFIQDLYKFYLRACVELLSKYFDKRGKYTYLYDDTPLFVEGGSLEEAEERIKHMKTRARKKRKN